MVIGSLVCQLIIFKKLMLKLKEVTISLYPVCNHKYLFGICLGLKFETLTCLLTSSNGYGKQGNNFNS